MATRRRTTRTTTRSTTRTTKRATRTPDEDVREREDIAEGTEDKSPRPRRRRRATTAAQPARRATVADEVEDDASTRRRRTTRRTTAAPEEGPAPRRRRSRRTAEPEDVDTAEAPEERAPRHRSRTTRARRPAQEEREAEALRTRRRSTATQTATPAKRKTTKKKAAAAPSKRPAKAATRKPRTRTPSKAPETKRRRLPTTIKQELIASVNPRESRIALMEDGKAAEFMIDRPDTPNLVGSIILGRVDSIVPGIEAAFVDIGLEKNGFLYVQDVIGAPGDYDILESLEQEARPRRYQRHHINKLLKKDQTVVVQVKKEPMGGKGTRLTSYLTLPGRYAVLMPNVAQVGVSRKIDSQAERDRLRKIVRRCRPQGMGLILRTAAIGAHEDDIEADVEHLVNLWDQVQDKKTASRPPKVLHQDMTGVLQATREIFTEDVSRFVIDNRSAYEAVCSYVEHMAPDLVDRIEFYDEEMPLFEKYGLHREIDLALDTRVPLPSGGYLLIDQTEAVVTIDVNTGSYTGSRRLEETVYHTNLEAVGEVARQLRLRDLGGIILVDFIDMESQAYRRDVYQKMLEALERDRSKTRVQDMSELCIVQMTRKRTKYSLQKTLCSTCPTCHGKGWLRSAITQALHILHQIEMQTRKLAPEHVLVEAHPSILEYLSHEFAYELQDLENYIETLILLHPVEDQGHEYTKVIVEGRPLDAEGTARRRRRRGSRGGRGRRGGGSEQVVGVDGGVA